MNTFEIALLTIATFFMIFLIYHIVIYGKFWKKRELIKKSSDLDANSRFLLLLALSLIIIGLSAPFILTGKERTTDFVGSGEIGDTIGGIANPFISIAAVIVTGLAFYMQFIANKIQLKALKDQQKALKEQKTQFEQQQEEQRKITQLQQFENQFYEMLRLHKENVNEIEVKDINGDIIKGRPAFLLIKNKAFYFVNRRDAFQNVYKNFFWSDNFHSYLGHYYRHLFYIVKFVHKQDFLTEEQKLDYLRILRAQLSNYEQEMLFYNWLSGYGSKWEEISPEEKILYIINEIKVNGWIYNFLFTDFKLLYKSLNKTENKKKLLNITKKLKNGETLSENDENYLKELHKKIKEERQNKNQFFTRYKIIHNLWYNQLYGDFIKIELEILKNRYTELDREDKLFEIDE